MGPKFGEVWQWNKGSCHVVVLIISPSPDRPEMAEARTVITLDERSSAVRVGYTTNYWGWGDKHWKRIDG